VSDPDGLAQHLSQIAGNLREWGRVDEMPISDAVHVGAVRCATARVDQGLIVGDYSAVETHASDGDLDDPIGRSKAGRLKVEHAIVHRVHRLVSETETTRKLDSPLHLAPHPSEHGSMVALAREFLGSSTKLERSGKISGRLDLNQRPFDPSRQGGGVDAS